MRHRCRRRVGGRRPHGGRSLYVERVSPVPPAPRKQEENPLTSKSFLNIDHLPRARLHKPTAPAPRVLQPLPAAHHPAVLQIALVPRDELDRLHAARVLPVVALAVDHLHEVVEGVEGGGGGDVVDEEEGVRLEVRGGPEAAIFLLPGRVGQGEEVGPPVDGAGRGVGVLCGARRGWSESPREGGGDVRGRDGEGLPIVGSYLVEKRDAVISPLVLQDEGVESNSYSCVH